MAASWQVHVKALLLPRNSLPNSYGAVRHPALAHSCGCPGVWLTSEEGSNLNNNLLVLHGGAVLNHDLGDLASLGRLLSPSMEHLV